MRKFNIYKIDVTLYNIGMEESLDELYQRFLESRKKKLRELIEVQDQMSIAEEVSRIKRTQRSLEDLMESTESAVAATKLSGEIRANSNFLMEVMGVGKENLTVMNQSANSVLPSAQSTSAVGVIEAISFDEES